MREHSHKTTYFKPLLVKKSLVNFLDSFWRECGAECAERTAIDNIALRAKSVEYVAELVEYSCNVRLSYGRILCHSLAKLVELDALLPANGTCHKYFLSLQRAHTHFSFIQWIVPWFRLFIDFKGEFSALFAEFFRPIVCYRGS